MCNDQDNGFYGSGARRLPPSFCRNFPLSGYSLLFHFFAQPLYSARPNITTQFIFINTSSELTTCRRRSMSLPNSIIDYRHRDFYWVQLRMCALFFGSTQLVLGAKASTTFPKSTCHGTCNDLALGLANFIHRNLNRQIGTCFKD